jgi:hypothetical protein
LPYRNLLLPVAALFVDQQARDVQVLEPWYWNRTFTLGYDAAANTRTVADYRGLRATVSGDYSELTFRTVSRSVLLESTRRGQTAVWRGMLNALRINGAVDLADGHLWVEPQEANESLEFVNSSAVSAVSLIPKTAERGYRETPPHLRALGMILVNRETAATLRRAGVDGLLEHLREQLSATEIDARLDSQFLPPLAESALLSDWRVLLDYRLARLADFLEERGHFRIEDDVDEDGDS